MADLNKMSRDLADIRARLAQAEDVREVSLAAFDGVERMLTEVVMELSRVRKAVEER